MLAMAIVLRIRLTHDQHDLAARPHRAGGPPLAAIEDVFIPVTSNFQFHVGGIGRRHLGFGHGIGTANPALQQGFQPLLLLGLGAVFSQYFHVAPVRCIAVENTLGPHDLGHGLKQGRDFHIAQARAPGRVLVGQEQVPQPLLPGLVPDTVIPIGHLPKVLGLMTPLVPIPLTGINVLGHKSLQLLIQGLDPVTHLKSHRPVPTCCVLKVVS